MSNKIVKPLTLAIGAAFVGSLSLASLAQANSAFGAKDIGSGYMVALAGDSKAKGAEGKCGEGKCGVAKMDKNGDKMVSMDEAKAGGFSEAQVKAWDKNGDGMLDDSELKAMHTAMDKGKGANGSCGANKDKGNEKSCGAAKDKGSEKSCGHNA